MSTSFTSWALSRSLALSLFVLGVTSFDASAQSGATSNASLRCPGSGGSEGWIDFGDEFVGFSFGIVISDALTGEKLWPLAPGAFVVQPDKGDADLLLDTTDNSGGTANIDDRRLYLPKRFYVLSFFIPETAYAPARTIHIAWDGARGFPNGATTPYSFYNPVVNDTNIDTCFLLDRDTNEISIASKDVQEAGGGESAANNILGNAGWTLPYDGFVLCAAQGNPGCRTTASDQTGGRLGQFISYKVQVTPVQGQFGEGYKLVPSFRFASAVRTPASYPAHTWDVPNLVARFAPSASLTAEGTLNAAGATFTADNPALGWQGIRFEPGSGGTWTNAVIERVAGDPILGPGQQGIEPLVPAAAIRITGASPSFTSSTCSAAGCQHDSHRYVHQWRLGHMRRRPSFRTRRSRA